MSGVSSNTFNINSVSLSSLFPTSSSHSLTTSSYAPKVFEAGAKSLPKPKTLPYTHFFQGDLTYESWLIELTFSKNSEEKPLEALHTLSQALIEKTAEKIKNCKTPQQITDTLKEKRREIACLIYLSENSTLLEQFNQQAEKNCPPAILIEWAKKAVERSIYQYASNPTNTKWDCHRYRLSHLARILVTERGLLNIGLSDTLYEAFFPCNGWLGDYRPAEVRYVQRILKIIEESIYQTEYSNQFLEHFNSLTLNKACNWLHLIINSSMYLMHDSWKISSLNSHVKAKQYAIQELLAYNPHELQLHNQDNLKQLIEALVAKTAEIQLFLEHQNFFIRTYNEDRYLPFTFELNDIWKWLGEFKTGDETSFPTYTLYSYEADAYTVFGYVKVWDRPEIASTLLLMGIEPNEVLHRQVVSHLFTNKQGTSISISIKQLIDAYAEVFGKNKKLNQSEITGSKYVGFLAYIARTTSLIQRAKRKTLNDFHQPVYLLKDKLDLILQRHFSNFWKQLEKCSCSLVPQIEKLRAIFESSLTNTFFYTAKNGENTTYQLTSGNHKEITNWADFQRVILKLFQKIQTQHFIANQKSALEATQEFVLKHPDLQNVIKLDFRGSQDPLSFEKTICSISETPPNLDSWCYLHSPKPAEETYNERLLIRYLEIVYQHPQPINTRWIPLTSHPSLAAIIGACQMNPSIAFLQSRYQQTMLQTGRQLAAAPLTPYLQEAMRSKARTTAKLIFGKKFDYKSFDKELPEKISSEETLHSFSQTLLNLILEHTTDTASKKGDFSRVLSNTFIKVLPKEYYEMLTRCALHCFSLPKLLDNPQEIHLGIYYDPFTCSYESCTINDDNSSLARIDSKAFHPLQLG